MPDFRVPVTITISGHITVKSAPDKRAAMHQARQIYAALGRDKAIELPSVDVDFALGDDPAEVEQL